MHYDSFLLPDLISQLSIPFRPFSGVRSCTLEKRVVDFLVDLDESVKDEEGGMRVDGGFEEWQETLKEGRTRGGERRGLEGRVERDEEESESVGDFVSK